MLVQSAYSHKKERVLLQIEGNTYLIIASELQRAIENATNFDYGE